MNINLLCGDCLELMKDIPDKSVDMILCDLPYGTTACIWDIIIPIDRLFKEYRRIIKSNGVIALFGNEPFSTKLRIEAMDLYKYDWIWIKNRSTGFVHAKNMPLKKHEIISIFSTGSMGHKNLLKEKRMTYNPQGIIEINQIRTTGINKFKNTYGIRPFQSKKFLQEFSNYPESVLYFNKVSKPEHPTQKPVDLLEYLIKTYTNEGETILDNCMGSGSTGVACIHTNRNFIGMELDETYFKFAKERIENEEKNYKLWQ